MLRKFSSSPAPTFPTATAISSIIATSAIAPVFLHSKRAAFVAASKSKSASGAWVSELDAMLKRRDEERRKLEQLAEQPHLTKDEAAKMKLVAQLMMRDDEVLEVKRINSLSLERISEHQRRTMQTSEEKGMYVEDAINKQVLDAFANTDYNKKRVTMHWMQARQMRYWFIGGKFVMTFGLWFLIHWWYATDPNLMWVEKPSRLYYPNIRTSDVGVAAS